MDVLNGKTNEIVESEQNVSISETAALKSTAKQAEESEHTKNTTQFFDMEQNCIPIRSESKGNECQESEKMAHNNVLQLNAKREAIWSRMDNLVEETEAVYKSRVALIKSIEKEIIQIAQVTAKNALDALDKNREILHETIAPSLQEFETVNKICVDGIGNLNVIQNRLKETADRIGFNL